MVELVKTVRLDQWLHAARFFKTRGLAAQAVKTGKVLLNDARTKPAAAVRTGAMLRIQRGTDHLELSIRKLSTRRGPAKIAQTLYDETATSVKRREQQQEQRRFTTFHAPSPERRPDKKSRRQLIDLQRRKQ